MNNNIDKIGNLIKKMKSEAGLTAISFILLAAGCYLIITHWNDNVLWVITGIGYFIAVALLVMKLNKANKKASL